MKCEYINWSKANRQNVTIDEFDAILEDLEKHKYTRVKPSTKIKDYTYRTFSIDTHGKYKTLGIVHDGFVLNYYTTNYKDNTKNIMAKAGKKAYDSVSTKFQSRCGLTITKAFGSSPEEFKNCIPKQFYYINEKYIDKANAKNPHKHISAIDFCSQYPTNLCGDLPDYNTAVTYEGTVKPTKEYPFAFYLKSGHCAEYNSFDTHDWITSYFKVDLLGRKENKFNGIYNINPEEDTTILMKASKYHLAPEMRYFYSMRKKTIEAKLVMNAFIGFLHRENYNSHKQAHIAAIVIARSNEKMRKLAEEIQFENGYDSIVHICVDGCIYKSLKKYGIQEKALGNIYQEFYDCDFKLTGMNCYVAMKNNKVIKFKHGAFDERTDGIDIETCESFDDMYKWRKKERKFEKY